jgi:ABC-type antimicrobial peptide transport system ATPase subunit
MGTTICVARAIYARRDILLLDDILASLDTCVAMHIFCHCLNHQSQMSKTRIVVTNHLAFLQHPSVDRVCVFHHDDKVVVTGPTCRTIEIYGTSKEEEEV